LGSCALLTEKFGSLPFFIKELREREEDTAMTNGEEGRQKLRDLLAKIDKNEIKIDKNEGLEKFEKVMSEYKGVFKELDRPRDTDQSIYHQPMSN